MLQGRPLESSCFQLNEFNFERLAVHIEEREGNRQLKSARPRASRIDVEYAIALGLSGLMGMPTDDDVDSGGHRIQVQSMDIVENIEEDRTRFCHSGIRQIASVDNQVGAAKCIHRLRTL